MMNKYKGWLLTAVIFTFLLITMLPYYIMIVMGTHDNAEIFKGQVLIPGSYALENLQKVLADKFLLYLLNSFYIAAVSTFLAVFVSALTGYSLSKFDYKHRDKIFVFIIAIMMIPGQLGLIAFIIEMRWFGWVNTHLPFIVPAAANSFGVFWLTQYMRGAVPKAVIESARIDGAHEFKIFYQIVTAFIKPALITLSTLCFLGSWNNFVVPSLILNKEYLWTIPLAITKLGTVYLADYAARIMGLSIGTLPLLLLFILGSKYFTKGIITGVIKG